MVNIVEGTNSSVSPPVVAVRRPESVTPSQDFGKVTRLHLSTVSADFRVPWQGSYTVAEISTPWIFVCTFEMSLVSRFEVSWMCSRCSDCNFDSVILAIECVHDNGKRSHPLHGLYRCNSLRSVGTRLREEDSVRSMVKKLTFVERLEVERSTSDPTLRRSKRNVNTKEKLSTIEVYMDYVSENARR